MIKLTPVTSSNIEAIGYDAPASTLYIRFNPAGKPDPETGIRKPGKCYAYYGVPRSIYDDLMLPGLSIGSYFHSNIKGKIHGQEVENG